MGSFPKPPNYHRLTHLFQTPFIKFISTELKAWNAIKQVNVDTYRWEDRWISPMSWKSYIYQCRHTGMNQLVQRLDKINSDSQWNQTFLIYWKRARPARLRQHLENTSIKRNDYYKINFDLLAQTPLISQWTNCSEMARHPGWLWQVFWNSNF